MSRARKLWVLPTTTAQKNCSQEEQPSSQPASSVELLHRPAVREIVVQDEPAPVYLGSSPGRSWTAPRGCTPRRAAPLASANECCIAALRRRRNAATQKQSRPANRKSSPAPDCPLLHWAREHHCGGQPSRKLRLMPVNSGNAQTLLKLDKHRTRRREDASGDPAKKARQVPGLKPASVSAQTMENARCSRS